MGELQGLREADFNWALNRNVVWDDELPDAPGLHGDVCDELIESAQELKASRPALGRILLGSAGAGKTHLLAMLRRRAVRAGITFVMADLTDVRDFHETLLLSYVTSLKQPNENGRTQLQVLLTRLIELLSTTVDPYDYIGTLARFGPEAHAKPITDILANLQRRDPVNTGQFRDVVRAAVLLNAEKYDVNSIGYNWLQGTEIEDEPKRIYNFATARQKASDVVQGLSWLTSLCGPSIVAIDQLDPIVAQNQRAVHAEGLQGLDESIALAKHILNDLCNGLGGLYTTTFRTLPVVTCLEGSFGTLEKYGLRSNLDRFEPPQTLTPLNDAGTAEALVRSRLDRAYVAAKFTPPYPAWPFTGKFFAGAVGHAPRELLKRCDAHRRLCLRQGDVTELDAFEETAPQPAHAEPARSQAPLDRRFEELRRQANVSRLLDDRWEDERLAKLMETAAVCLVKESPTDDAHDVVVDSDFPGRASFMPLHARIRKIKLATGEERHYCLRALEKNHHSAYMARLKAAITSAGIDRKLDFRHLVIFRTNPVPRGEKTAEQTRDFENKGGLMVAPAPGEIATLWALQQLSAEGHDGFDEWLILRQPVHQLPMMQAARLAKAPVQSDSKNDPTPAPVQVEMNLDTPVPAKVAEATPITKLANAAEPIAAPAFPVVPVTSEKKAPIVSVTDSTIPLGRRIIAGAARGDVVGLPLVELKKHVAIIAGAGSGKTVLVKRLIEEAALLGVPAIVIDTANDLAQLGDPWPEAPESWDGDDSARATRFFENSETIVWTPGLERGNPLHLEPLPDLAAVAGDVDELNDALAMAREALQDIVAPTKSEASRNRLGILTAALRFFAEQGGGKLEAFIALLSDLPTDADGGISDAPKHAAKMADALRSQMQIDPLLGGSGEALDPAVLLGLDGPASRTRISVINFTGLPALDQQQQFLNHLAMTLFSWIKRNPASMETPLRGLLILDEAKDFIPAVNRSACRESFMRLAAQARKYGLGLVFATQAPKDIHNAIVSNCSTSFYGKGNSPTVINAIKELLKNKGGHGDDVARLGQGQFYVHNADVTPAPIKVGTRLCLSWHREPLTPDAVADRACDTRTV